MDITPVILEGKFVRLEPMAVDHVEKLCEVGLDPELWRVTMTLIQTPDDMKKYVETALKEQQEGRSLPFVTIERSSGGVIGSSRYGNIDRENRRVEIGWTWVAKRWQRSVVNTEAKYLMLRHAFETLECIRVEFKTDSTNGQSRKALLRISAKEEGILRNHMITPSGRIRHSVYYSIIDTEWPEVKKRMEEKLTKS